MYATIHVMRDPKGKTASDLFPDIFEDEDIDDASPISEEDAAELQELMTQINAQGETQQ